MLRFPFSWEIQPLLCVQPYAFCIRVVPVYFSISSLWLYAHPHAIQFPSSLDHPLAENCFYQLLCSLSFGNWLGNQYSLQRLAARQGLMRLQRCSVWAALLPHASVLGTCYYSIYIHLSPPTISVSLHRSSPFYILSFTLVLIYSSSQRIPKFGKFLGPTVLPFSLCSFAAIFSYSAIPFRTTTQKGKGTECHTIALR